MLSADGPKCLPPSRAGYFLYVRPTIIGTQPTLGVQAPKETTLFIIPGIYATRGHNTRHNETANLPEDIVRSWQGGIGHAKVGVNYGLSVLATQDAFHRGFDQILWLYGETGECTEAGGNLFVF